jgi:hypothetical protein
VREDGRIAGEEEWHEKVYNREEWKKLEYGKESSHSAHANGMNEYTQYVALCLPFVINGVSTFRVSAFIFLTLLTSPFHIISLIHCTEYTPPHKTLHSHFW